MHIKYNIPNLLLLYNATPDDDDGDATRLTSCKQIRYKGIEINENKLVLAKIIFGYENAESLQEIKS